MSAIAYATQSRFPAACARASRHACTHRPPVAHDGVRDLLPNTIIVAMWAPKPGPRRTSVSPP